MACLCRIAAGYNGSLLRCRLGSGRLAGLARDLTRTYGTHGRLVPERCGHTSHGPCVRGHQSAEQANPGWEHPYVRLEALNRRPSFQRTGASREGYSRSPECRTRAGCLTTARAPRVNTRPGGGCAAVTQRPRVETGVRAMRNAQFAQSGYVSRPVAVSAPRRPSRPLGRPGQIRAAGRADLRFETSASPSRARPVALPSR